MLREAQGEQVILQVVAEMVTVEQSVDLQVEDQIDQIDLGDQIDQVDLEQETLKEDLQTEEALMTVPQSEDQLKAAQIADLQKEDLKKEDQLGGRRIAVVTEGKLALLPGIRQEFLKEGLFCTVSPFRVSCSRLLIY